MIQYKDWYLERKGCVSLEQREEERTESRHRMCWQVDRAGSGGAFSDGLCSVQGRGGRDIVGGRWG